MFLISFRLFNALLSPMRGNFFATLAIAFHET
jgi:hypothetical protein